MKKNCHYLLKCAFQNKHIVHESMVLLAIPTSIGMNNNSNNDDDHNKNNNDHNHNDQREDVVSNTRSINYNNYSNEKEEGNKKRKIDDNNDNNDNDNNNDNNDNNNDNNHQIKKKKKKKKVPIPPTIISTSKLISIHNTNHHNHHHNNNDNSITSLSTSIIDYNNNNTKIKIITPKEAMDNIDKTIQIQIQIKPLIILDMNGILCHRIRLDRIGDDIPQFILSRLIQMDKKNNNENKNNNNIQSLPTMFGTESESQRLKRITRSIYRDPIGHVACTPIVARTDLEQFLRLLHKNFTLAVWSSAKKKTVNELVRLLFPVDIASKLLFVWGQDKCDCVNEESLKTLVDNSDDDNTSNILAHTRKSHYQGKVYIKKLSKVWHQYPLWDEKNTLLIDDSPDKCPIIYRNNTLHPPPISGIDFSILLSRLKLDSCSSEECLGKHNDHDIDEQYLRSSFSDDKINEEKQRSFFTQLGDIFDVTNSKGSSNVVRANLMEFLLRCGKGHMNWRG